MEPARTVDYGRLPDGVLVRMSRDGDKRAYGVLVARHHRWVIGVALSVWDSRGDAWQDAMDIAQNAFVNAYNGLAKGLRTPDNFRAYMHRVTRNAAADFHGSPRTVTAPDSTPDPPPDDPPLNDADAPQDRWASQEDVRSLMQAGLARLGPEVREAILMRFGPGELSFKEMALSLGIGVDGAEKRVQRGVAALRRYFESTGAGALLQEVRFTTILAVSVAAGFTEQTMASVNALPRPNHSTAPIGRAWVPYVVAGMSAVVAVVAGLGALATVTRGVAEDGAVGKPIAATVAPIAAALSRPASPHRYPRVRKLLDARAGSDGWVADDPTFDGTRPIEQGTHVHGRYAPLMNLNGGSIRQDFEPAEGIVAVSMWIQPPHGAASIRVGLLIGGTRDPLNAPGVFVEKDELSRWSYPLVEIPASGVAPVAQRERPSRPLQSYESRPYELELVHDTHSGSFDIWLDGERVAKRIARPWSAGQPVTGVYIGGGKARTQEGQAVYFGDVTATARDRVGAAEPARVHWVAAPLSSGAWSERSAEVLAAQLSAALDARDVAGARSIADNMLARFRGAEQAINADRRVTAAEAEVARLRPSATEDMSRVRSAVGVLARRRQARTTDEAFEGWLREHAYATQADWDGWLEENVGGKHLYVAYRPEHYVGRLHLFSMALEVVRAYHHLNAHFAGSIGVEVRHPDGGDRSLAAATSWDLGDAFHRRFSPGGATPAPRAAVTDFVIGPAGEVFANQAGALLVSDAGGTNWRRDDGPTERIEALFAAGGVVYGQGYGARALVARGLSGAWETAASPPDYALVASAFLGGLSTPDIDPRIGQGNEADGRRDITDITPRGDDVYGVSDGAVTLRDAVHPIPAWRVVLTPNSVNFPDAEAAFRARYTETVMERDWLWENTGMREATLATVPPPPELVWQGVVADSGGWVDLQDQLRPAAPNGLTTAYMVCYVDAPDARRVALNTMRTGALGVWVNGRRIPDAWDVGDEGHDNTISIPLRAGRNVLMIKLGRLGSRWGVQARLLPEGVEGVRVASELGDLGEPLAPVTGDVWVHVNHMLTSRDVHALHVSGDRLYAATNGDVWVFSANELRWTRSARGVADGPNVAYALTTHGDTLYSARKGGVFRLDPDTHVWEARSAGLDDRHVRAIASAGGVLLAGTHQGHIYLSADDGRNWERVHGAASSLRL